MNGLDVRHEEGVIVVRFLAHKLTDDEHILRISDDLNGVLDSASSGTQLLLDFKSVESVASMMLGDLVALNKKALRKGVILQLCGLSSGVSRVIKTCKLDRLFNIVDEAAPPSE